MQRRPAVFVLGLYIDTLDGQQLLQIEQTVHVLGENRCFCLIIFNALDTIHGGRIVEVAVGRPHQRGALVVVGAVHKIRQLLGRAFLILVGLGSILVQLLGEGFVLQGTGVIRSDLPLEDEGVEGIRLAVHLKGLHGHLAEPAQGSHHREQDDHVADDDIPLRFLLARGFRLALLIFRHGEK